MKLRDRLLVSCLAAALFFAAVEPTRAQVPPAQRDLAAYTGLHAAAAKGDAAEIQKLAAGGNNLNARDGHGRTPLMVAAFQRQHAAARALIEAGADLNALESQAYDVITIAAVLDDLEMLKLAIRLGRQHGRHHQPLPGHRADRRRAPGPRRGGRRPDRRQGPARPCQQPRLDGADRGHRARRRRRRVIRRRCAPSSTGGADLDLADGRGVRPLALARQRGYAKIAEMLEQAGAKHLDRECAAE